ncbi:MAG TPA: hypothetical protein VMD59_04890 [Acidimicrobiales bacterium]|nr:hypothetical protein [Acidimicrobiales bacterium]
MTTALEPWGPWSVPQLIFDPDPNPQARTGYCYFMYSTATTGVDDCHEHKPAPPNPKTHGDTNQGIYFFPTFVARWTTGSVTKVPSGTEAVSTF